ncbi:hypothetical protein Acr_08g0011600 [Actinidia rufa]|uniref:Uncharacterized protein n=1 Tax=Actinidia rufa TaxID=165716 RepID=A0A7J0F258_9ERIC|nr:hypothetical protein Acr_08g0011600 [Actinidia rufa]
MAGSLRLAKRALSSKISRSSHLYDEWRDGSMGSTSDTNPVVPSNGASADAWMIAIMVKNSAGKAMAGMVEIPNTFVLLLLSLLNCYSCSDFHLAFVILCSPPRPQLREKSYMEDEVTRLPSSPREDSFSPESSPSAIVPSVEREVNIMTPKDLEQLQESALFPRAFRLGSLRRTQLLKKTAKHFLPASVDTCFRGVDTLRLEALLNKSEEVLHIHESLWNEIDEDHTHPWGRHFEVQKMIEAQMAKKIEKQVLDEKCHHLKLVAKELILEREVLTPAIKVSTLEVDSQRLLVPNAWHSVVCAVELWRYHKIALYLTEFKNLFGLYKNPNPYSGWLYFMARSEKTMFREYPNNVKGWKRKFSSSRDNWEFLERLSREARAPKVPRSWGIPVAFGEGDNGEDVPASGMALVAGDKIESHPFRTMSKRISLKKLDQKMDESKSESSAAKPAPWQRGWLLARSIRRKTLSPHQARKAKLLKAQRGGGCATARGQEEGDKFQQYSEHKSHSHTETGGGHLGQP